MTKYCTRRIEDHVLGLLTRFPAVTLVGARQVGKTMMAQHLFPDWEHFDLERGDHHDLIARDLEFFFSAFGGNIWFDEAQRLPELFSHLRTVIDRFPDRRFVLLGSAGPSLFRNISESLAGRCVSTELFPFSVSELPEVSLEERWTYGGYPRLYHLPAEHRFEWLDAYIQNFINRDIPALGFSLSTQRLQRLLTMLAHCHGGLLNLNQLATSLGCSTTAVYDALDVLEQTFLVRRLQPFHANVRKRLVKSPKVYIRDTGVLHRLLGIDAYTALLRNPVAGTSWEGLVIESIAAELGALGASVPLHFWRTHAGAEVDLLMDLPGRRVLVEVKLGGVSDGRELKGLRTAIDDLGADEGWVVAWAGESTPLAPKITRITLPGALDRIPVLFVLGASHHELARGASTNFIPIALEKATGMPNFFAAAICSLDTLAHEGISVCP